MSICPSANIPSALYLICLALTAWQVANAQLTILQASATITPHLQRTRTGIKIPVTILYIGARRAAHGGRGPHFGLCAIPRFSLDSALYRNFPTIPETSTCPSTPGQQFTCYPSRHTANLARFRSTSATHSASPHDHLSRTATSPTPIHSDSGFTARPHDPVNPIPITARTNSPHHHHSPDLITHLTITRSIQIY